MDHADQRKRSRAVAFAGLAAATAACALAGCAAGSTATSGAQELALSAASSSGAQVTASHSGRYQVLTLNDNRDLTFNQLLGINNEGKIVGYFGSGDAGHPNKGYALSAPYAQRDFGSENFPGSAQTQITAVNDAGVSVGFYSPQNDHNAADNSNFAFWRANGRYHRVSFPAMSMSKPVVDQLLGVNDTGTAVGFYNDAMGNAHGYAFNIKTGRFKMITVPGATAVTATGINNRGTAAGFFSNAKGAVEAFTQAHGGVTKVFAFPGATMTQAFGINDSGEVVGAYTAGKAENAVTHGFTWANGKFTTVTYPLASATTVNGVNDEGDIVGFYTDAKGNTDGFVGLP